MNSLLLADLQTQFMDALQNESRSFESIIGSDAFSQKQRLNVYRTNGRSVHVAVLMDLFPVCKRILGAKFFKLIAKKYYKEYPSKSYDLNQYGDLFPEFINKLVFSCSELFEYKYLSDMGKLEWNIQEAHLAADHKTLDIENFKCLSAQAKRKIIFRPQASVSVLETSYPIYKIWKMHQNDQSVKSVNSLQDCERLCVYRKEYDILVELIDKDVYLLLKAICDGKNLSELADLFQQEGRLNNALEYVLCKQWLWV